MASNKHLVSFHNIVGTCKLNYMYILSLRLVHCACINLCIKLHVNRSISRRKRCFIVRTRSKAEPAIKCQFLWIFVLGRSKGRSLHVPKSIIKFRNPV